jgi:hypothetical protein
MRIAGKDKPEIIHDKRGYIALMYAQGSATCGAEINFGVDNPLKPLARNTLLAA